MKIDISEGLGKYYIYIDPYKEISIDIAKTPSDPVPLYSFDSEELSDANLNQLFASSGTFEYTNPNGFLAKDNNGNPLKRRDCGLRNIKSCDLFPYGSEILLYNDFEYTTFKSTWSDYSKRIRIPKDGLLRYKFGYSEKVLDDGDRNGYKFSIDMSQIRIFKAFLNGTPLNEYKVNYDTIEITGNDKYRLRQNKNNILKLMCYSISQSLPEGKCRLSYYGCDFIDFEKIEQCDFSQFDENLRIKTFTEFGTTQDKTLYTTKQSFSIIGNNIVTGIANKLTIQPYDSKYYTDYRYETNGKPFRIIMFSPFYQKIIVYTNCQFNDGVGTSVSVTAPNTKTYTIDYEERIEMSFSDAVYYGVGGYGEGYYNGYYLYSDERGDSGGVHNV